MQQGYFCTPAAMGKVDEVIFKKFLKAETTCQRKKVCKMTRSTRPVHCGGLNCLMSKESQCQSRPKCGHGQDGSMGIHAENSCTIPGMAHSGQMFFAGLAISDLNRRPHILEIFF